MNEKIFLLGCWNKNACLDKGTKDGRLEVINLLSREPKQYNFGILLGDNIYPLKSLKQSTTTKRFSLKTKNSFSLSAKKKQSLVYQQKEKQRNQKK